jgi:CheY-like chemotaxis protein
LKSAGYEVDYEPFAPQTLKKLKNNPPAAVIIDLSRLPSEGRDVAIRIRHAKATRKIPIIFVEGDQEKVDKVKTHVPDALYTDYNQINRTLREALANPPKVTTIPKSIFEPYRNVPLAKKLGIKSNITLTLIDPPEDFARTLGELPRNVTIQRRLSDQSDVFISFVETQKDLNGVTEIADKLRPGGKLWIAWRKKTPEGATSVTQTTVRKIGLSLGLVDYKVCSIDATWTGLLFTRRHKPKQA